MLKKCLLLLPLITHVACAQEDWWFEVEVLLYKREQAVELLEEQFAQPAALGDMQRAVDLITPRLRPNVERFKAALPDCHGQVEPVPEIPIHQMDLLQTVDQALEALAALSTEAQAPIPVMDGPAQVVGTLSQPSPRWQAATAAIGVEIPRVPRPDCVHQYERAWLPSLLFSPPQPDTFIAEVPSVLSGVVSHQPSGSYLIPREALQLRQLAQDLARQRGISPLLHLGWRQQVAVGRNRAASYRLFGGHNFAREYDSHGQPLAASSAIDPSMAETVEETSLMAQVQQALSQPLRLTPVASAIDAGVATDEYWELDGLFKVYLQYINRVPYLHIDAKLVYRKEGPFGLMGTPLPVEPASTLDGAPGQRLYDFSFDQLRRVISKQLHYFDHPMFGMVVQIRRYEGEDE